jgi:TrmH family RNA methyltransferase
MKYLRSLTIKKYRESEGKFILEGWKPLDEALRSDFTVEALYVKAASIEDPSVQEYLAQAESRHIPLCQITELELSQISGTVQSQGVFAVVHQQERVWSDDACASAQCFVALDGVGDPGNVGTIIRTADWFGVDAVLLGNGSASIYNEKVLRSTSGSIFHLPIYEKIDLPAIILTLKQKGFTVIATAMEGQPLETADLPLKRVYLFGNEAHGISPELRAAADCSVSIPKYGKAESLNVGVACGTFLAQWRLTMR